MDKHGSCTDIHGLQVMNPAECGDPLTILLEPPSRTIFVP